MDIGPESEQVREMRKATDRFERETQADQANFDQRALIQHLFADSIWHSWAMARYCANGDLGIMESALLGLKQGGKAIRPTWHEFPTMGDSMYYVEQMFRDYRLLDGRRQFEMLSYFFNWFIHISDSGKIAEWLRHKKPALYKKIYTKDRSWVRDSSNGGQQFLADMKKALTPLLSKMMSDKGSLKKCLENPSLVDFVTGFVLVEFERILVGKQQASFTRPIHDIVKALWVNNGLVNVMERLAITYQSFTEELFNGGMSGREITELYECRLNQFHPIVAMAANGPWIDAVPTTVDLNDVSSNIFQTPEVQEILKDPNKTREYELSKVLVYAGVDMEEFLIPCFERWEDAEDRSIARSSSIESVTRNDEFCLVLTRQKLNPGKIPACNFRYITEACSALNTSRYSEFAYGAEEPAFGGGFETTETRIESETTGSGSFLWVLGAGALLAMFLR